MMILWVLYQKRRTNDLKRCNGATKDEHRASDKKDILEDTGQSQDKAAASADKEHGGNVQQEGYRGVAEQNPRAVRDQKSCERCSRVLHKELSAAYPTRASSMKGSRPSVNGRMARLMSAQTGA